MSKDYLPDKIDPFKAAAHGIKLHGFLKVKNMNRLLPLLHASEGEVQVNLDFSKDEQGICIVRGHIQANFMLQCQRCMGSLNYEIMDDFISGVVDNEEQATDIPEGYDDIIIANEAVLAIQDMIEDDLIISLPIVPMHDPDVCNIKLPLGVGSHEPVAEDNNPFKVISILRSKSTSKKE
jgi:uncharacterized protein